MTVRSGAFILLAAAAFSMACDVGRSSGALPPEPIPTGPNASVLTTLQVLPSSVTLEQVGTTELQVIARDQRGVLMAPAGTLTFRSSNPAIARVSDSGVITGVAAGTADIFVTKTVSGVTRVVAMQATVRSATPVASLSITADLVNGWQPSVAHVTLGGTVRWVVTTPRSVGDVPHRMLYVYDRRTRSFDSLDLRAGFATRTFVTPGEYTFCSAGCFDPPDGGVVYVH